MIQVQRLNMDNSLFLEISGWKVLIDPWLEGTEVDFFGWFNTQWHRTPPLPYEQIPAFDTVLIYDAFILDDGKESVFLATHGFQTSDKEIRQIKKASACRLLINPFNYYKLPFFLGGVVSPGMDGVKHLCEVLDPKKVIATHDEDKHAKGLVSKFAKVIRPSSPEALQKVPWLGDRYLELNHYQKIKIS